MPEMFDREALREAYRRTLEQAPAGTCPSEERLAALVVGEIEGNARTELADHVVRCMSCGESYRMLRRLHGEVKTRSTPPWRSVPVRVAAVVLISLGGIAIFGIWHGSSPLSPETEDVRRGVEEQGIVPSDRASLSEAPDRLEWLPQLGAARYRVRLFQSDAEPLWVGEPISETTIPLPPRVRAELRAGSSYFWTVEVDGAVERSRLGPFWFHLEN